MALTIADLGERALIERIRTRPIAPSHDVIIAIGDDAAVVEPPRGELEVVTTDTLVDGVHFDQRFCSAANVGEKALAVNLSDLAAMGAAPRFVLLALGLPDDMPVATFEAFVDGFMSAAVRERVAVVGGNITRSPASWFITVTAFGSARRRRVLARAGARVGDVLYVTGQLGAARAGLHWLSTRASAGAGPESEALQAAVAHYRTPRARVHAGVSVARSRAATACMDLSDGLADAVTQVARASGTGALIDLASLPTHPAATLLWPDEAAWQALVGGDDYELLFAVAPRRRRAFEAAAQRGHRLQITRIGCLTPAHEGRLVVFPDGTRANLPEGYEHFIERPKRVSGVVS